MAQRGLTWARVCSWPGPGAMPWRRGPARPSASVSALPPCVSTASFTVHEPAHGSYTPSPVLILSLSFRAVPSRLLRAPGKGFPGGPAESGLQEGWLRTVWGPPRVPSYLPASWAVPPGGPLCASWSREMGAPGLPHPPNLRSRILAQCRCLGPRQLFTGQTFLEPCDVPLRSAS